MRGVALLGSTGSIGRQAVEVIRASPGLFRVCSLAAHRDAEAVAAQMKDLGVMRAAMVDTAAAAELRERVPGAEILEGAAALEELAAEAAADIVLNAVVGAAGLRATIAALDAGKMVALANKESCVAGGPLVASRLRSGPGTIVPVDSEHASVHMCLAGEDLASVTRVVLTASGGPFRGWTRDRLERATVEDALRHPTWRMGAKITIDSATLMNKGLEVIEARVLFGLDLDRIAVLCHPQSIVHCLVGFRDGSWKSALGPPDMRVPIAYALGHPDRPDWGPPSVDWATIGPLSFEPVDTEAFPSVRIAYDAARAGGTATAVLNAANEVAVQAFLDGRLPFTGIADACARALEKGAQADIGYGRDDVTLDEVLAADTWARRC